MNARRESGFVSAEWVAGIAFLLVPTLFFVFSIIGWPERQGIAREASQQAARAAVQTDSVFEAGLVASEVARESIADQLQIPIDDPYIDEVQTDFAITPSCLDPCIMAGRTITVTVRIPAPLVLVPDVDMNLCCKGKQTEPVDDYRSSVAGP